MTKKIERLRREHKNPKLVERKKVIERKAVKMLKRELKQGGQLWD